MLVHREHRPSKHVERILGASRIDERARSQLNLAAPNDIVIFDTKSR